MKQFKNYKIVMEYAESIVEGRKIACRELKQGCQRFIKDLKNPVYELNPRDAEFVIGIIEKTFVHMQGERIDRTPLRGTRFLLEPLLSISYDQRLHILWFAYLRNHEIKAFRNSPEGLFCCLQQPYSNESKIRYILLLINIFYCGAIK